MWQKEVPSKERAVDCRFYQRRPPDCFAFTQCIFQSNIFSYLLKNTMQVPKSNMGSHYGKIESLILIHNSQKILENSHSYSQLSKNSFRTLILILNSQKILERSHSRSRLSVHLISQKSDSGYKFLKKIAR